MPEEFSRTTARKRITLPSGAQVDVPVITKLSVIDASDRYQETQFEVDNSALSSRQVHVDTIHPTSPDGQIDTSKSLQVERIDQWPVLDASDRAQETQVTLDNRTGADSIPPHFSTHQRTHLVKYFGVTDPSVWIQSELIDELRVIDASDRYQESWLVLNNPATDAAAQANPTDPNVADSANGIDPAWRTDPFQNIVNFKDSDTQFGPPPAVSIVVVTVGDDQVARAGLYAASAAFAGASATFAFPTGDIPAFTADTTAQTTSTIEMMNPNNPTAEDPTDPANHTGFDFWGTQNPFPADIPNSGFDPFPQMSVSGMTVSAVGVPGSFDFTGIEFTPYQKPPGTGQDGNFLDYYPALYTGQTGWKYVPDGNGFYTSTASNQFWLKWMPQPT